MERVSVMTGICRYLFTATSPCNQSTHRNT